MSILERVYASGGEEVLVDTLELSSPAWVESFRFCNGFDDRLLTNESGATRLFSATAIQIALPKKSNTGTQTLTFAIPIVDGSAQQAIDQALESGAPCTLTYRVFLDQDPTAPAQAPYVMTVTGGVMEEDMLTVQAGFFDMLNTAWPRLRYTTRFAPGLTYL